MLKRMNKDCGFEEQLSLSIKTLAGVGVKRSTELHKMGIFTLYDLLLYFPRAYKQYSFQKHIEDLRDGENVFFVGQISNPLRLVYKNGKSVTRGIVSDATGSIAAIWFNQAFLKKTLQCEVSYLFKGQVRRMGQVFEIINPKVEKINETIVISTPILQEEIIPVYSLSGKLPQKWFRELIKKQLFPLLTRQLEFLPEEVLQKHNFLGWGKALQEIHAPSGVEALASARERLIYDELLLVQLGLRSFKYRLEKDIVSYHMPLAPMETELVEKFIHSFPFTLTQDQQKIYKEMIADLASSKPMNRLIQGDVGSGKTILAVIATFIATLKGYQVVVMAPTGILAKQHFDSFSQLFSAQSIAVELLLGSTSAKEKRRIKQAISANEIKILIGTQAVLSDPTIFPCLGLVITDEQHRFGVNQRKLLPTSQHQIPHTLVMSATPIPRTLGLIIYGDLDISVLKTLPEGRKKVQTFTATEKHKDKIKELIQKRVEKKQQVYYICPLIGNLEVEEDLSQDELAKLEIANAVATYQVLKQEDFSTYSVGLLHGKLPAPEKEILMTAFLQGEIEILVATTVIEVGINNPNATLMVIENAERFGLAQLHQLRGRVGRGEEASLCILKTTDACMEKNERLKILCRSNDGFEIAEKDLRLRGPGDFFGIKQHGDLPFRLANLCQDQAVVGKVNQDIKIYFDQNKMNLAQTYTNLCFLISYHFGEQHYFASL